MSRYDKSFKIRLHFIKYLNRLILDKKNKELFFKVINDKLFDMRIP